MKKMRKFNDTSQVWRREFKPGQPTKLTLLFEGENGPATLSAYHEGLAVGQRLLDTAEISRFEIWYEITSSKPLSKRHTIIYHHPTDIDSSLECDRCHMFQFSCTCRCRDCPNIYFDMRHPIHNGEKITFKRIGKPDVWLCDECYPCYNCGAKGRRESEHSYDYLRIDGVDHWICRRPACQEVYLNHPNNRNTLFKAENETKKDDFPPTDSIRGYQQIKAKARPLFCPDLFGVADDVPLILKKDLIKYLLHIFYDVTIDYHRMVFSPVLDELFKDEFAKEVHRRKVVNRNQRARAKYPEQKAVIIRIPEPGDGWTTTCFQGMIVEKGRCRDRTEATRHLSQTIVNIYDELKAKQLSPENKAILVAMMKRWFELGYYPVDRKDYTDVPLKKQLFKN